MPQKTIEIKCTGTELCSLDELLNFQGKLKKLTKKKEEELRNLLIQYGFTFPFFIWKSGESIFLIDGHQRVKTLKHMREDGFIIPDLPVVEIYAESEKEAKEKLLLVDDKKGQYNKEAFVDFVSDLNNDFLGKNIKMNVPDIEDFKLKQEGTSFLGVDAELEGAFQLKNYMKFDSSNFWGIPELDKNKCVDKLNLKNIVTYCGNPTQQNKKYLYLYASDVIKQDLDCSKSILGFYVDDVRFERLWVDPAQYVSKILNLGFKIALAPNFSVYSDDSRALQLLSIYKSRWLGKYMQKAGIMIIPDINFSDELSYDYCFLGLPENCYVYSIQFQNHKDEESINNFKKGLNYALNKLRPQNLIIYCQKGREELLKDIDFCSTIVYYVYNRLSEKWR